MAVWVMRPGVRVGHRLHRQGRLLFFTAHAPPITVWVLPRWGSPHRHMYSKYNIVCDTLQST
jgi:hypothetical protein